MKKVKILALGLTLAIGFMACQKENTPNSTTLDASKTTSIAKGEPVVFTLSQTAGSAVNWSVTPSANTQINTNGNQASIKFGAKGNYVVTGVTGNVSASRSVSVLDSTYNGGGGGGTPPTTLPFSAGELIKITASRIDSGSTSGLIFSAITTNSYTCLSNSLLSTFTSGANSYGVNFTGVSVPGGCTTGTAKAGGFDYLYPLATGTSTLTINFNGTNYSGTIVKTGNNYVINWSYTTGVTISPTSL